ncbi:hypothetical protein [Virgibacillus sediminis]|uniref:Uncharacterized protein n=1 Tax=Virgibacillus sediminis TaxID=202260 RepID=A0ABV7A696_9BACI
MIIIEQSNSINWWAIAGSIASVLASVVAVITVWFQKYKYDKERTPIVSPLVTKFSLSDISLLTDWESKAKIGRKWSEVKIVVKNYGKESIIDMNYSYAFKNYKEMEDLLVSFKSESPPSMELRNPEFFEGKKETILTQASLKGDDGNTEFDYSITRPLLHADPLTPQEEITLILPSYFIILTNYLITSESVFNSFDIPYPVLELYVHCKDTDQRNWLTVYELYWDDRKNIEFGYKGKYFELILNSKHVLTKKFRSKTK